MEDTILAMHCRREICLRLFFSEQGSIKNFNFFSTVGPEHEATEELLVVNLLNV